MLQKTAAHHAGSPCPASCPFKARRLFHKVRPENILISELLTASTYPLICKYHPPGMSSYLPGTAQEDIPPHYLLSAQKLSAHSGVAVYPLEDYMEMSGDCWVNTLTRTEGTGAQQINHWQLDIFVPFKWLHSTATLSTRNIDLVCYISPVVQQRN